MLILKNLKPISKTMKGYKAQLKNVFFEIMLLPQLEYEYFNGHGKHNGKKKKYRLTFIISNRRPTEAATGGVL